MAFIKKEEFGIEPDCESISFKKNRYDDVFKEAILRGALYTSTYNFPLCEWAEEVPEQIVPFDKINQFKKDKKKYWVHFYIKDVKFEKLWKNPLKYLSLLQGFQGCIMPDYSLYRDMPIAQQIYNVFRNRVLAYFFTKNGIKTIFNLSFSDERSLPFALEGVPKQSVLAVSNLGTMASKCDAGCFEWILDALLLKAKPKDLVLFGSVNNNIIHICVSRGVALHLFKPIWDTSFITKETKNG